MTVGDLDYSVNSFQISFVFLYIFLQVISQLPALLQVVASILGTPQAKPGTVL